ncbi:hypothetical protein SCHPADRAFT_529711 [Schizopora paradoxa]|uniref:Uncharacterized protein n=1 Tax=Schizopora paradoxa TaxID=27342 RepID=A0A0H2RL65_9AGAM|nr:hypothetical protein SCHPADRAFT_529711 [Schizopora paradoxa]
MFRVGNTTRSCACISVSRQPRADGDCSFSFQLSQCLAQLTEGIAVSIPLGSVFDVLCPGLSSRTLYPASTCLRLTLFSLQLTLRSAFPNTLLERAHRTHTLYPPRMPSASSKIKRIRTARLINGSFPHKRVLDTHRQQICLRFVENDGYYIACHSRRDHHMRAQLVGRWYAFRSLCRHGTRMPFKSRRGVHKTCIIGRREAW